MHRVCVLYSRLGKTAVDSMQEGTKLLCRKTLTRHLINMQEVHFLVAVVMLTNPFIRGDCDILGSRLLVFALAQYTKN